MKFNTDTENGQIKKNKNTFSKAHHFGYPAVSFRLARITNILLKADELPWPTVAEVRGYVNLPAPENLRLEEIKGFP